MILAASCGIMEVPEMIRVASPMYVKLGLRNAANIYPSGMHIEDLAVKQSRERGASRGAGDEYHSALRTGLGDGRSRRGGFGDTVDVVYPTPNPLPIAMERGLNENSWIAFSY